MIHRGGHKRSDVQPTPPTGNEQNWAVVGASDSLGISLGTAAGQEKGLRGPLVEL
jgi:hypothetical protein